MAFAKRVLNCESRKSEISIEDVAKSAGEYFGVTVNDFKSSARNQRVSSARHIAVYLSREITGRSFESIAEYFNKKHTTMLYSYDKIKNDLKVNKKLENTVSEIKRMINHV